MASRFWVGGAGTWDATTTTHWAATSGGAGGASVPGATDDVHFDGNSGTGVVTLASSFDILSIDCTGYTGTITGGFSLLFNTGGGNATFPATMAVGSLGLNWHSGVSGTLTSGGHTFLGLTVGGGSTGGVVTLGDACIVSGIVSLVSGTLNTNGKALTCGSFTSSNANTRTLTLGASAVMVTGAGTVWDCTTSSGLTVTANTATISFAGGATWRGGGLNWNGVSLVFQSGTNALGNGGTYANVTALATSGALTLTPGVTVTITGTLTLNGTTRIRFASSTAGSAATVSAATVSLSNVDFQDITAAGTATWAGPSLGNISGNTGITFTARFWVGGTGNWSDTTHWSTSSGGATGASVPTSSTDVNLDANSGAGTMTVDATAIVNTFTAGAYAGAITLNAGFSVRGNVVLPTAAILIAGNFGLTMIPGAATTATVRSNGSRFNGGASISGLGTTSLLDAATFGGTITHVQGTFQTNGNNVSAFAWSSNNSNTRTLSLGASVVTLSSGVFSAADFGTTTGLTMAANTATLKFTGGGGINVASNLNYNGLSLQWINGGTGMGIYGGGGNTFRSLTLTGAAKTDQWFMSNPNTFTGVVTFAGASQSARAFVGQNSGPWSGSAAVGPLTLSNNGSWGACANVDFADMAMAGTAGSLTGTLIGDAGGNSGITFTAAAAQSWVGTAGGNWSDGTKWTSRVPLPQDDVTIASAFIASQTVSADMPRLCRNLSTSGATGSPTLAFALAATRIYGSSTITGVGISNTNGTVTFAGRGTHTISDTVDHPFSWQVIAVGGTYTLAHDYLATGSFNLQSGTFDTAGFVMNSGSGFVSTTGRTRTLKISGSTTWTIATTGNAWNVANDAGMTVIVSASSTIALTGATNVVNFLGGGFTYGTLRFASAGANPLNITGSNTFAGLDVEYVSGTAITGVGGVEITDALRTAALSWGTTQLGGSVDGPYVTNICANGGFESGLTGWLGGSDGAPVQSSTWSKFGTKSAHITNTINFRYTNGGTSSIPTYVGAVITASAWVNVIALPSSGNLVLTIDWYTAAGALVTTSPSAAMALGVQRATVTATAPATAAFYDLRVQQTSATNNAEYYIDGVQIEAGNFATNYVETNGAIASGIVGPNGYGVYHNRTNLFRRGQCDSSTDWLSAGIVTSRATDATTPAPYSPQSIKVVTSATGGGEGLVATSASGLAAAAGVFGAGSLFFKGTAGLTYNLNVEWLNTDASVTPGVQVTVTATGFWQLVIPAGVAVAAGKTGDSLRIRIGTTTTRVDTIWAAHAHLEQGMLTVPGPYVATSGGSTATIAGTGQVNALSGLIRSTPFWIAVAWRAGWNASARTDFPELFEWRTDAANREMLIYNGSISKWVTDSRVASIPVDAVGPLQTFVVNDLVLVVGTFSSAQLGISVNASALATTANTEFVSPSGATFGLNGAGVNGSPSDGSALWTVTGIGVPNSTDLAMMQSAMVNGTGAPDLSAFSTAAGVTSVWPALTTATNPGRTLILPAGGTQTVTGSMTITGTSTGSLSIMSSTPGTQTTVVTPLPTRSFVTQSGDVRFVLSGPLTDIGLTVTDSLRSSRTRPLIDRGLTITDTLGRVFRRTLTDTGLTVTDSLARVVHPAPVNTSPPLLFGIPVIGNTLAVTSGTWTGSPTSYAYQWFRSTDTVNWTPIAGATGIFYTLTNDDRNTELKVEVSATNVATGTAWSNIVYVSLLPGSTAGTLGCGTYEVYAFPRGGGGSPILTEIPWTQVAWGRILDDTSQSSFTTPLGDCGPELAALRTWQHEIAVYRDGMLIWQGPLFNVEAAIDDSGPAVNVQFQSRDLSAWWDMRLLHSDHVHTNVDLATIFNDYHTDAMAPDTSPNFSVTATPCGVLGTRSVLAGSYLKAGQEMRSVADIGIDWTVVGRTALVGGLVVPTSPLPTLTDDHFVLSPTPHDDGSGKANRQVMLGAGTNDDGTNAVVGIAVDSASETLDGLLEEANTDTSILDNTSAAAAATTKVALTKEMVTVEQAILSPTAPITVDQLIPGALCRLELAKTFPPFSGNVRIKEVAGTSDQNNNEQIVVTFQPEGTT